MRLRTKFQDEDFELGEVADVNIVTTTDGRIKARAEAMRGGLHIIFYKTKAEFDADWEDAPEEPKGIKSVGNIGSSVHIELGSKEEAEKAVERLRAWQRLKKKGFRFAGDIKYECLCGNGFSIPLRAEMPPEAYTDIEVSKDLDLLFSGEDD